MEKWIYFRGRKPEQLQKSSYLGLTSLKKKNQQKQHSNRLTKHTASYPSQLKLGLR
jgi:hypothetical protein